MEARSHSIRSNGVELHVVEEGEGPPVLLVHGFPDDHAVWRKQIPVLVAAGYHVIAIDTRGCGLSDIPARRDQYALPHLVADIAAVLDHFGIDQVRLVAHDWGAVIAWQFCMAHPDCVERFIALSVGHPTAYASAPLSQKLKGYYILLFQIPWLPEWLLRLGNWRMLGLLTKSPNEVPNWRERLSRPGRLTAAIDYYRANFALLLPRQWPKVAVPVMGIWSDRDVALGREQMENTGNWVTGPWRFEVVSGVGHWFQLDAPDQVNSLLLDYLKADLL